MPYDEEDTRMPYEEEDACMSHEEEDACVLKCACSLAQHVSNTLATH